VGSQSVSYLKVKIEDLYLRKGILEGTDLRQANWKPDDHAVHNKYFPKW